MEKQIARRPIRSKKTILRLIIFCHFKNVEILLPANVGCVVHIIVLACLNDEKIVFSFLETCQKIPLPLPQYFLPMSKMFVFDHIERVRARPWCRNERGFKEKHGISRLFGQIKNKISLLFSLDSLCDESKTPDREYKLVSIT